MRILFETATSHLKNNKDLALVTVIASSGATPRGAGAHMLVGESGRLYGTIGGGAVEHRSIEIAQKVIAEKASRAHDFSLTRDDVQALGMICGGDVRVFFTYLSAEDQALRALFETAAERFQAGGDLWLICACLRRRQPGVVRPQPRLYRRRNAGSPHCAPEAQAAAR